jgi:hypothetical protein
VQEIGSIGNKEGKKKVSKEMTEKPEENDTYSV